MIFIFVSVSRTCHRAASRRMRAYRGPVRVTTSAVQVLAVAVVAAAVAAVVVASQRGLRR